jgi:hypothetical protein
VQLCGQKGEQKQRKPGFSFFVVEQQGSKEQEAGVNVAVRGRGKLKSRRVERKKCEGGRRGTL